jgi:hypothetical protein
MPEPRYFSMPSIEVGAEVFRNPRLELLAMGAIVEGMFAIANPAPFAVAGSPESRLSGVSLLF